MKAVINLDNNFKPFDDLFNEIEFKRFSFPSGCEPHIKIIEKPWMGSTDEVVITSRIKSSEDVMILLLATDALKRLGFKKIKLFLPYLPFARQDRVMVDGEPLSIKVFANLINSQEYVSVAIYDVHSEVSLALINNCESVSNHAFVNTILDGKNDYYMVSPDAGAYKKIFKLCQYIGYTDTIVLCNKIRDVKTGEILNMTCDTNDLNGKDVYITDDICSKGGTFIGLAETLKKHNAGNVYLIVSHYENVANEYLLKTSGIKQIFKTNSMNDYQNDFIVNYNIHYV